MISKVNFASSIQEMALLLSVEADNNYLKALYTHIADKFNDDEFKKACNQILINEDLYGKLPTVRHFMKYAPARLSIEDIKTQQKTEFLNKVCDYLQLIYASDYDREELYKGMSELGYRTLQSAGGMPELWRRVHDLDYPTSIAKIRKELAEFYDDNYIAESVSNRMAISDQRRGQQTLNDSMARLLTKFSGVN